MLKFGLNTVLLGAFVGLFAGQQTFVQTGREIRWLRTGSLHHYILNWGAEVEMGRTGRVLEQMDGLRWPAQFRNQDCLVAKGLWIGSTGYKDQNGEVYPHKVISIGPRAHDEFYQFIPVEFKMVGRFNHPLVYVDDILATDNNLNDIVDEVDPGLKADRLIINKLVTYMGVTVTRKVFQFAQQNHDNYIVTDYVFKNTGIVDGEGTTHSQTLEDVYFYFQFRYGSGLDAFRAGGAWQPSNSINWGRNAVNQVVGIGPNLNAFEYRAQYSWAGPHSMSKVDGWGTPNPNDGRLASTQYMGTVILHADKSSSDKSDDRNQPSTTQFIGSDERPTNYGSEMFDPVKMTDRYSWMAAGHPEATHADQLGEGFVDQWGTDNGGYSQAQGFGPYSLEPGDSIHIVAAEGVSGIRREKSMEVGRNWYLHHANLETPELVLPDGSTTADEDLYKKLWVQSGEDSILKTFRSAVTNYDADFNIPSPPPPPEWFDVKSGGDRIVLTWAGNAESYPSFDGYDIYRAVGKPDTLYDLIFSCQKPDVVNQYEDQTALRGFDYYYYIVSKDDGLADDSNPGEALISSKFWTMTNEPAYLRKPPVTSTLDSIRVVPNPFNIRSTSLQFGNAAPDRIAFYGLPPECFIRIYTERGDLVETIEHTDGTADEFWHSTTMSRQIVVSGVYLAYVEVTKDVVSPASGAVRLRKGEKAFRKFVIIR